MATPKDVLTMLKESGADIVDFRFFPPTQQHFSVPASELTEDLFEHGLGSTAPRSAGSRHAPGGPRHRVHDPFTQHRTLNIKRLGQGPGDQPRPPLRREEGRAVPEADRHGRHQPTGVRRRSSTSSTRHPKRQPARGLLPHRCRRRRLELRGSYKEAHSRSRRWISTRTCGATRCSTWSRSGSRSRCTTTRWARRPGEIDMRYDTWPRKTADNVLKYKYVVKNMVLESRRRSRSCRSPCSRTTARACTGPRGREPVLGRGRLRHGPLLHRRAARRMRRRGLAFTNPTTKCNRRLVRVNQAPINPYSQRNVLGVYPDPGRSRNWPSKRWSSGTP